MSLRDALQEMTLVNDVSRHEALLADITQSWPNSIIILDAQEKGVTLEEIAP